MEVNTLVVATLLVFNMLTLLGMVGLVCILLVKDPLIMPRISLNNLPLRGKKGGKITVKTEADEVKLEDTKNNKSTWG